MTQPQLSDPLHKDSLLQLDEINIELSTKLFADKLMTKLRRLDQTEDKIRYGT
jgi:hypothetical protein